MWDRFQLRFAEWKLNRQKGRHKAKTSPDIERAREERMWLIEQQLVIDETRRYLFQQGLIRKARSWFLRVPSTYVAVGQGGEFEHLEFNQESWLKAPTTGKFLLKDAPLRELQHQVRAEARARRDMIMGWISPVSSVVGTIVGVILGYLLGTQ